MKVSICPKCKTKELKKELESLPIELEWKCILYCGVGKNKFVALFNDKPIISNDKEEFLSALKKLDNSDHVC